MFTLQALTSYYLGTLSDELCACGLHALALPVETLRLMAAECLLQSVSASQLVHLRYSHNVSCSVACEGNTSCVHVEPYRVHVGWCHCAQQLEPMLQENNIGRKPA